MALGVKDPPLRLWPPPKPGPMSPFCPTKAALVSFFPSSSTSSISFILTFDFMIPSWTKRLPSLSGRLDTVPVMPPILVTLIPSPMRSFLADTGFAGPFSLSSGPASFLRMPALSFSLSASASTKSEGFLSLLIFFMASSAVSLASLSIFWASALASLSILSRLSSDLASFLRSLSLSISISLL